jgi:hypothetical protein
MSELSFFLIVVSISVVTISLVAKKILHRSLWDIFWDWVSAIFS